jgi:hypothetical protein
MAHMVARYNVRFACEYYCVLFCHHLSSISRVFLFFSYAILHVHFFISVLPFPPSLPIFDDERGVFVQIIGYLYIFRVWALEILVVVYTVIAGIGIICIVCLLVTRGKSKGNKLCHKIVDLQKISLK